MNRSDLNQIQIRPWEDYGSDVQYPKARRYVRALLDAQGKVIIQASIALGGPWRKSRKYQSAYIRTLADGRVLVCLPSCGGHREQEFILRVGLDALEVSP